MLAAVIGSFFYSVYKVTYFYIVAVSLSKLDRPIGTFFHKFGTIQFFQ